MSRDQKHQLRRLAAHRDMTMQAVVHEIIDDYAEGKIPTYAGAPSPFDTDFGIEVPGTYGAALLRAENHGASLVEVVRAEIELRWKAA